MMSRLAEFRVRLKFTPKGQAALSSSNGVIITDIRHSYSYVVSS